MGYSSNKLSKIFSNTKKPAFSEDRLDLAECSGEIPPRSKGSSNKLLKTWCSDQWPLIGERFGFISKPLSPKVFCFFVTKGGVLKSSLAFNMARMTALHNIRTCVIGLDLQGDLSNILNGGAPIDGDMDFQEALDKLNSIQGLYDFYKGSTPLSQIICSTDLPSLFYIPETPELVALEQELTHRSQREYWLKKKVIKPLIEDHKFDLIILDGSPNWNQLITNALTACDVLVSPLECKINNYRNFKMFTTFISEFKADLDLEFSQSFVPTRFSPSKKLSQDIKSWYQSSLKDCTKTSIRESIQGEEAIAMCKSTPEYAPTSLAALEINQLISELWEHVTHPNQQVRNSNSNNSRLKENSRGSFVE